MTLRFFIAGTDTEIGKTFTTCALLTALHQHGLSALGMKPIAAGADDIDGDWVNEDVAHLRRASHPRHTLPALSLLNPYCLHDPIAPHIAAADAGITLSLAKITEASDTLASQTDVLLIEGVGGFRVPLAAQLDTADLCVALGAPVVLVVGLRLGCLSHALLTVEAIQARGLTLAGWVANRIDPDMLRADDNLLALQQRITAPCLGVIPHLAGQPLASAWQQAGARLDVSTLLAGRR